MSEVKVHEKYLVVIPKEVRKALGIKIGETVEFVVEKGKAVLYPHRGSVASVKRIHGIIRHKGMTDEGIEKGYRIMAEDRNICLSERQEAFRTENSRDTKNVSLHGVALLPFEPEIFMETLSMVNKGWKLGDAVCNSCIFHSIKWKYINL